MMMFLTCITKTRFVLKQLYFWDLCIGTGSKNVLAREDFGTCALGQGPKIWRPRIFGTCALGQVPKLSVYL